MEGGGRRFITKEEAKTKSNDNNYDRKKDDLSKFLRCWMLWSRSRGSSQSNSVTVPGAMTDEENWFNLNCNQGPKDADQPARNYKVL